MFGLDDERLARLIYLLLLAVFIGAGLFSFRRNFSKAIREALVWIGVLVVLLFGYTYREQLLSLAGPVLSELNPSRPVVSSDSGGNTTLTLARSSNGHFQVTAAVDGTDVTFLIDTGASRSILSYLDAERVGLAPDTLNFSLPVNTANGMAFQARAPIRRLEIGPYQFNAMRIGVAQDGMLDTSLLGLDILDQFGNWRVEGDRLILAPPS